MGECSLELYNFLFLGKSFLQRVLKSVLISDLFFIRHFKRSSDGYYLLKKTRCCSCFLRSGGMHRDFEPKIISVIREGYSFSTFLSDLNAGVITGIIALPLAIAFGIASGVSPAEGLYTAIVAGLVISLLSGSRYQIGGPTGAFVVIVYGIVQEFGIAGLGVATLMAGVILILMGLMKFGSVIKFIPYPVTLGFTSGIGLLIATTQVRDLFGLSMDSVPAEFFHKLKAYWVSMGSWNPWAVVIGVGTVVLLFLWPCFFPKISRRLPGSVVAIVFATFGVMFFDLPVETIGSRFGKISGSLPSFSLPVFGSVNIVKLVPAALSIALLGAIESLLSAVVADGMTGRKHRSNMELVAQGVANIASPLFGGIPATGAIARTAANIKNGGKTPFAGIIHALVLLLILVCFGSLASLIPMAVLAGILINVAYKMAEVNLFVKMFRAPKSDIAVMIITFVLTVVLDLTIAIPVGMVLASFMFMHRMEQVCGAKVLQSDEEDDDERCDPFALSKFYVPEGVEVFEINGPFFFGAASKFQDSIDSRDPKVLILRMRNVPVMDATGMFALENIIKKSSKQGQEVLISGIHPQPLGVLHKSGILELIGDGRVHRNIETALKHAADLVNSGSDIVM